MLMIVKNEEKFTFLTNAALFGQSMLPYNTKPFLMHRPATKHGQPSCSRLYHIKNVKRKTQKDVAVETLYTNLLCCLADTVWLTNTSLASFIVIFFPVHLQWSTLYKHMCNYRLQATVCSISAHQKTIWHIFRHINLCYKLVQVVCVRHSLWRSQV